MQQKIKDIIKYSKMPSNISNYNKVMLSLSSLSYLCLLLFANFTSIVQYVLIILVFTFSTLYHLYPRKIYLKIVDWSMGIFLAFYIIHVFDFQKNYHNFYLIIFF